MSSVHWSNRRAEAFRRVRNEALNFAAFSREASDRKSLASFRFYSSEGNHAVSASNAFETDLLELVFNNTNIALIGDATGLRGSSSAGVFYQSLHISDPGEAGSQTTNETAYTNYDNRVSKARSAVGYAVSGSNASNEGAIDFPQCGASGATLTHFGIGTANKPDAGYLLFKGALDSPLTVSNGVTPSFADAAMDVNVE